MLATALIAASTLTIGCTSSDQAGTGHATDARTIVVGVSGAFAENQPVTSIVNAIRDLFTQQPVGSDIWIALAWCVGILVVAYVFAMVTYRRRIS